MRGARNRALGSGKKGQDYARRVREYYSRYPLVPQPHIAIARYLKRHCGAFRARVRIFQGFVCSSTTVLYNIAIIIYF